MREITIRVTDQSYDALTELAHQSGMPIEREAAGAVTRGLLSESRLSFQWWHEHPFQDEQARQQPTGEAEGDEQV